MPSPDIAEQIRRRISEWQSNSDATVSEQAMQIVIAAVSAIVYDPHPRWRLPREMMPFPSADAHLREIQQDAIEKIPEVLDEIRMKSGSKHAINTFDMLHLSSDILQKVCPFDKSS